MKLSYSCQNSDRLCFSGIHLVWINLMQNWPDTWVSIDWRSPPDFWVPKLSTGYTQSARHLSLPT